MIVGITAFIISLSILFYRHPPPSWPLWALILKPRGGQLSDRPLQKPSEQPPNRTVAGDEAISPGPVVPGDGKDDVSSASPQTTPKAIVTDRTPQLPVPSFSLEADASSEDEDEDTAPPPSFPAMNSAQRASEKPPPMGPPPPKLPATSSQPRPSQLMAPPPRVAASSLRALPTNVNSSLRIPSTGPLPNRGPPASNSLGPPSSAPIKTPNARNKVQLTPGHSPLDWANMQKAGNNLSGVSSLVRVTPTQLKYNNGRKGRPAWSSYLGKVYNITPYLPFHPGGEGELRRAAGKDGGKLFMEVHPWVNWENMLGECLVGIMVGETDGQTAQASALEDMD